MSALGDYIKSNLKSGYSKDQITKHLLDNKYSKKQIEKAFVEESSDSLTNYVALSLKQGHSKKQIYDYLIEQGYTDKQLRFIFNDHPEIHLMKLFLAFVFILILGFGVFYFIGEDVPKPSVEFNELETVPVQIFENYSDEKLFNLAIAETEQIASIDYCKGIENNFLLNECFTQIASFYDDEGICLHLEEKDSCYLGLIVAGRTELCEFVEEEESLNICSTYLNI